MKILFLSQVLPLPLDAGPKVRSYYVLRHLVEAGHDVSLLSFIRAADSECSLARLRELTRALHTVEIKRSFIRNAVGWLSGYLTDEPFLISRDRIPQMQESVNRLLSTGSFDAVHVDQLWMSSFVRNWHGKLRIVLDQHNAVFKIPARMAQTSKNPLKRALLNKESERLIRYESDSCGRADHIAWVTKEDLDSVGSVDGNLDHISKKSSVIPICVDPGSCSVVDRKPQAFRVTFLGGMNWPPNAEGIQWFAREVWPEVSRKIPEAVLTVIGQKPPRILRRLTTEKNVETLGYVADLEKYLAETSVFIVPLHAGGGMRVKILDAWLWGLPTVSTTVGAEGLATECGKNILIADSPDDFASAVINLLTDAGLPLKLSRAGRSTVERSYDWRKVYLAWDDIYR